MDMSNRIPVDIVKVLVNTKAIRTCLNCINFEVVTGCLKAGCVPPPNVVFYGCDQWEDDDIPF